MVCRKSLSDCITKIMAKCRSISTVSIILWLTLRGCRNSLFATLYRIFVKMKQSFQIYRCHSEYIQFPTASCEGGLSKTCGQQGAGLKKGWLPCLHEGAHLFNPVRRSRNRKAVSPCRSEISCSPSEGRVGRKCMRTNGIVCYMRTLLSPLQIPIFVFRLISGQTGGSKV